LLFRGFKADKGQFMGFARLFMKRVKTTPEIARQRDRLHPGLQTALLGTEGLNFHADFSQVPERTHVICFYCLVPAKSGGETLLTDGEQLFLGLVPETQKHFLTRRIRHESTLNRYNWSAFAGTQDAAEVVARAATVPDLTSVHNADDSITTTWVTSAVTPSVFREAPALCTNIFPGVYNGLVTTWEDGEAIAPAIIEEIQQVARKLSNTMVWDAAGDFAILDNTRYVHARTRTDGIRQLFTLQGYVK